MFINESIEVRDREAATLGHALYLLHSTERAGLSLRTIHAWLRVPVRLDQILLLFGENKTPEGYVTWAWVTPETAARLAAGDGRALYPEEWNDGTLLWIVDVVAPFGQLSALIRAVRAHFAGRHDMLGYLDRRCGQMRIRRWLPHTPRDRA